MLYCKYNILFEDFVYRFGIVVITSLIYFREGFFIRKGRRYLLYFLGVKTGFWYFVGFLVFKDL